MKNFWTIFFVAQLEFVKGKPSLQIFKIINGTDVPVNTIREVAGRHFTLTCKLIDADNNTTDYFDDKISWGWNRKNVQFSNTADLKNLATSLSNPLKQFINKRGNNNEAIIHFQPLIAVDSGKYFCMSLKYKLFNIIKIRVKNRLNYELVKKIEFGNNWGENNLKVITKPSVACKRDMFMCNSRKLCVNDAYVCDNIEDCYDGSDENIYLCGIDTCKDKRSCSNGRCVSESLCCDAAINSTCSFISQPSCCEEILRKKSKNYLNKQYRKPTHEDNIPRTKIRTRPNSNMGARNVDDDNNRGTTLINHYGRYARYTYVLFGAATLAILLMVKIGIWLCGKIKQCRNGCRRKSLRWRICTLAVIVPNNEENAKSSNNFATESSTKNYSHDLPPTYDEAVVNVPQVTSLFN